ncbi:hypothetical protein CXB51_015356 [Gossypium anomalum]|uniref:Uncharacterized protein n=1 Tax=Gossypium anomalum TaxID=47600 RepID=A0A8J5ZBA8_9ROSI|nr:hypothetical protein CXB51_015356 [Gossypium anomalum]
MDYSSTVRIISGCFVKPQHVSEQSKQPFSLTTWDLVMLSVHYIQKGLLYTKPPPWDYCEQYLDQQCLGRLATKIEQNPKSHSVFVDCKNSPGAKFIHAAVDLSVSDIVSPTYVPLVVQSFFEHDRAINYDGHTRPLLSIQVTELVDGVFIGCSMNHAIADEQRDTKIKISRSPMLERWFPEGNNSPLLTLPFTHQNEFITRLETSHFLERIFYFSTKSITKLKERANTESNTTKISSFQSLSAFVWRSITRARHKSMYGFVNDWLRSPFVYQCSPHLYSRSVIIGSSPRFNMYGNEFGLGKALTFRSGYGNKFDGKVSLYPGREGKGSVDIEICLPSFSMNALESDEEFMAAVS